jgi:hypothetical protein
LDRKYADDVLGRDVALWVAGPQVDDAHQAIALPPGFHDESWEGRPSAGDYLVQKVHEHLVPGEHGRVIGSPNSRGRSSTPRIASAGRPRSQTSSWGKQVT